jgi:glutamate decarboxylase
MYASTQARCPTLSPYEMDDGSMSAGHTIRIIQDDLLLDGSPALNLAGFANTYMEPEIEKLMFENLVNELLASPCRII